MDRYEMLSKLESEKNAKKQETKNDNIESDFILLLKISKDILIYILLFIPKIIGVIIFLLFNIKKSKKYFNDIIIFPVNIIKDIYNWFFEAKNTAYLTIFIIIAYILQISIINNLPNPENFFFSFYDLLNNNYYSFITSIFLHANPGHLFGNLLFLVVFGRIVEKHFKSNLYWIFLISGIIANIISGYFFYLASDPTKSLGASGAIAGLIILAIMLEPFTFTSALIIPLPIVIVGWFGILNDIYGFFNDTTSNVNHLAHLSGYFALMILFLFFNMKNKKKVIIGFISNIGILIITYIIITYFNIQINSIFI